MATITVDGEVRLPVRFLVGITPYGAGERAGFREAFAHELVARGVAEYTDPADGPPRQPDMRFVPVGEGEVRMIEEIRRLAATRTMSRTERGVEDTTWGDAKWNRTLRDFFWPKGQGPEDR